MHALLDALAAAWQLVLSGDPTLVAIVSLSLSISSRPLFSRPSWGCRSGRRSPCCGFQAGMR